MAIVCGHVSGDAAPGVSILAAAKEEMSDHLSPLLPAVMGTGDGLDVSFERASH
jgi:hypothetical protein